MDNIPDSLVPEIVERQELTIVEKKIARIKDRMVDLLEDSLDVLHTAIKGNDWKETGKKVTRTQLYAASPIVTRFAPEIEKSSTGAIHFHMNVPRPKPIEPIKTVEAIDITQQAQNIGVKTPLETQTNVSPIHNIKKKRAKDDKKDVSLTSVSDSQPKDK